MSPSLKLPEFYNQLIRLSEEQRANPYDILEGFFCDYKLSELRNLLREMLETCLTTDEPPFGVAERRADLLLYIPKMEELLEAAYIVAKQWQDTGK